MKKNIIILIIVLFAIFLLPDRIIKDKNQLAEKYPWQISAFGNGKSRVFGIVLGETSLKEVDVLLNSSAKVALFEADTQLALEAYYKNVSLGGMIGSFIFTLEASEKQLSNIKRESINKTYTKNKGHRYKLNMSTTEQSKAFIVKNLIYIPTAQLDEATIIKRFGKPANKIKLKTKEVGWHYLYPEKGLDLIYKEEGQEVLQYVQPKNFNLLLSPLQTH